MPDRTSAPSSHVTHILDCKASDEIARIGDRTMTSLSSRLRISEMELIGHQP